MAKKAKKAKNLHVEWGGGYVSHGSDDAVQHAQDHADGVSHSHVDGGFPQPPVAPRNLDGTAGPRLAGRPPQDTSVNSYTGEWYTTPDPSVESQRPAPTDLSGYQMDDDAWADHL